MKQLLPAIAAAMMCCLSCVETDTKIGGNLLPTEQTYTVYCTQSPISEIRMEMVDSLSGFSSSRITLGAVRDAEYGLSTRSCAISIVPLADTLDFGTNPEVRRFHFAVARDTVSTISDAYEHILQNVNVYELSKPVSFTRDFDINGNISHGTAKISKGTPVLNGSDSLSFDFTLDYARKYLDITQEDLEDFDAYLAKFPGIYLSTDNPEGNGGRINMMELQLGYDSSYGYLEGNFAQLDIRSEYEGEKKDTSFFFYFGPTSKISADSLISNYSSGSYPQAALNMSTHQTRSSAGLAKDLVRIEGGGGLKPMIKASTLVGMAKEMIASKGASPEDVVINKATIEMPFEFPANYKEMERFPIMLSPTCRFRSDTSATFMSLTDSSNENENQGDIDRSNLVFAPDITYHLQELLKIKESDTTKKDRLENGDYDIWFLILANEVTSTSSSSSSSSSSMSDYYQYLAYQSYYNSMYGGYGGYGYGSYGYGYDSYGYNNYYTYMMMAQYASGSSSSSTSTTQAVDKDRYYKAALNGPEAPNGRVPVLKLTFSVPNPAQ